MKTVKDLKLELSKFASASTRVTELSFLSVERGYTYSFDYRYLRWECRYSWKWPNISYATPRAYFGHEKRLESRIRPPKLRFELHENN